MQIEGSAGGDLVTATVTGASELLGLVIKPEAVDPEDTETLADLIVAAVRDATNKAQAVAASKLGPLGWRAGRRRIAVLTEPTCTRARSRI